MGRPAADLLHERIATAKADDLTGAGERGVSTNYVGVSIPRLSAGRCARPVAERGSGIARLTLLTVYRPATRGNAWGSGCSGPPRTCSRSAALTVTAWLTGTQPTLSGRRPVDALRAGDSDAVVALARRFARSAA